MHTHTSRFIEICSIFLVNSCGLVVITFKLFDICGLQADNIINVVDMDSSSIVLSHRLTPLNTPPLEKGAPVYLTLQEILIVGNCHEQVHDPIHKTLNSGRWHT